MLFSLSACKGETNNESRVTTAETSAVTDGSQPNAENKENTVKEGEILDKTKEYSILFVGNSYTYYYEMPEEIFAGIAESAGYNFTVKSLTKGGWDLIRDSSAEDDLGALVDAELKETKYDYVVLQEQSTNPALDRGKFYDGARLVCEKVRNNGASPVLYSTWGRKEGSPDLEANGLTNETMTWKIAAAYEAIAEELKARVAHVGLAFYDVNTNGADGIKLYDNDMSHPSYKGSYLAALTIFAKITGVDPTTVEFRGNCPAAVAEMLREAARKAVFETPEIPEEYRTVSADVHMTEE